MTICSFKRTSTLKFLRGFWTPFEPEFYPFADVEEFYNPCYRWRFLELLRGSNPRWGVLLKNPNNPTVEYPQYFKVAPNFRNFAVVFMRELSRSPHPDSIIRSLRQPGVLLDSIRGNVEIEEHHINAIGLIATWLERLNNDGVLANYISTEDTLFNLQVMNENFDLYRHNPNIVRLTQRSYSGIGIGQQNPRRTFSWRGDISIFGTIPIIHLEKQEIRVPVPLANNFFNPPLDLSDNVNTPAGLRSFFIAKEFHKMLILRESLAQLIEDQKLPIEIFDAMDNSLFTSNIDLNSHDFRNFDIIVDTIDSSIRMNPHLSFRDETGQAAIILDLLYRNYPNIVNSFQDRGLDCPIRIGQDPNIRYYCPMGGTQGCGMSDKRIENLQFPRDRVETNVYKFLRFLRDETVFSHEILYKITRLYPDRLIDLNYFSSFWVGEIYQDQNQRWIFRAIMPQQWEPPQTSEKIYDVCLISPLCFEKGFKISFNSRLNQNEFVIGLKMKLNPWIQNHPFNTGNPILCLIGQFSIDNLNINIKRQKKQLVRAIQYQSRTLRQLNISERQNRILGERLANRDRRIGMATFGRFARYV